MRYMNIVLVCSVLLFSSCVVCGTSPRLRRRTSATHLYAQKKFNNRYEFCKLSTPSESVTNSGGGSISIYKAVGTELDWVNSLSNCPKFGRGNTPYAEDILYGPEHFGDLGLAGYDINGQWQKRWTNKIVPYKIDDNLLSTEVYPRIFNAMLQIQTVTCIKFRPATSCDGQVLKIHRHMVNERDITEYSYVAGLGMFDDGSDMFLSHKFPTGNTVHEFLHALGVGHEHKRPSRTDYIEDILEANLIRREEASQFNINEDEETFSTAYDLLSIMHYSTTTFGRRDQSGHKLTTIQLNPKYESMTESIGQRDALSVLDIEGLQGFYNCPRVRSSAESGVNHEFLPQHSLSGAQCSSNFCTMGQSPCINGVCQVGGAACTGEPCRWPCERDTDCHGFKSLGGVCSSQTPCNIGEGPCTNNMDCISGNCVFELVNGPNESFGVCRHNSYEPVMEAFATGSGKVFRWRIDKSVFCVTVDQGLLAITSDCENVVANQWQWDSWKTGDVLRHVGTGLCVGGTDCSGPQLLPCPTTADPSVGIHDIRFKCKNNDFVYQSTGRCLGYESRLSILGIAQTVLNWRDCDKSRPLFYREYSDGTKQACNCLHVKDEPCGPKKDCELGCVGETCVVSTQCCQYQSCRKNAITAWCEGHPSRYCDPY